MYLRLVTIFLPYLLGFFWDDAPGWSLIWSIIGSVLIAVIAQTNWFRQSDENAAVTSRLLRPASMHHLIFIAFHVIGGTAYALNTAGYAPAAAGVLASVGDLATVSECQRLMFLGHTAVTAGMKLVGFKQPKTRFLIAELPSYGLISIAFVCFILGTLTANISSLMQLSQKLLAISGTAIAVDIPICVRQKRGTNLIVAVAVLLLNIFYQSVSGWKGGILWLAILIGALLFPLMPRLVLSLGLAFAIFWAFIYFPFGKALRPLLWEQGVERNRAVELSLNETLTMSFDQRVETFWEMMIGRANELPQFINYRENILNRGEFYHFEIVSNSLIALIPRIIWRDKPDMEKISMQRVLDAKTVASDDNVSAKTNFYQDAYMSWGALGVAICCLLFGVLINVANRICESLFGGYEFGTCLIFTSLLGPTVNQPPNFEFFFGSMAVAAVLIALIFWVGRSTSFIKAVPANGIAFENRRQSFQNGMRLKAM